MGPLMIVSAYRITRNSASVCTWLSQWRTAAGLLIAGYLAKESYEWVVLNNSFRNYVKPRGYTSPLSVDVGS